MLASSMSFRRFYGSIMFAILLIAGGTSLLMFHAKGSDGWWNSNWGYRMQITFNNSGISENLVDFSLPVVFTSAQTDFWGHVGINGADIRFIDADDSTELYFELEHWNYTSNEMTAWVRIPQIDGDSITDSIWVYYGYALASFDAYYDSNGVWDSNYQAVWHLNQTMGNYDDATSNNNHLTTVSGVDRGGGARIGLFCPTFDGTNDYLSASPSASLNFSGDLMIEEWINTDDPTKEQNVISKNDVGQGKGWSHELYDAYDVHIQNGEGSPNMEITNTNCIGSSGVWYHVVWVWNEDGVDKAKAYVNGVEQTTTGTMADWTDQNLPLYIGLSVTSGGSRYPFDGKIDEVRLSNLARSPQWIKASYEYERDPTRLTFGSEEEGFWPTELFIDPPLVTKTLDQVGTTFKVNVTIRTVRSLQGFDFNLTWNNDLLALSDVDFGSTLDYIWGAGNWFLAYNQSGPGYCEVAAASTAASFTSQEAVPLTILTFRVKYAPSAETSLHFALAKLSDRWWRNIPATLTDGIYRFSLPQTSLYIDPLLVEKTHNDVSTTFGVNITVTTIVDLFGFDFNITWDSSLITLSSVDYTSALDAIWGENQYEVVINNSGNGWYKIVALSLSHGFNTTGAQTLVGLRYQVQNYYNWQAETPIHFNVSKLSNSTAQLIPKEVVDGTYRMEEQKPTLEIEPESAVCRIYGESFNVTIQLNNAISVKDAIFEIDFNTTMLDYVEGSASWGALGTGTAAVNETAGTLQVSVTSNTSISGNHTVLTFTFNDVFRHVWKDESQVPGWRNNQTSIISFRWANLSYTDHFDLRYEKGVTDQIHVTELAYTFSPIPGDVDNNGTVDIFDLRTVAYYYNVKEGDPSWAEASKYDLNGDKIIDILDLVVIAANLSV